VIISVAFDTGGAEAVREWIRPAEPFVVPPLFQDIMGWSPEELRRVGTPAYPCLIDEQHLVAELYHMTNVPMGVWIDENGRIVRPAEPTGATDGFRSMDPVTRVMPPDAVAAGKAARKHYVDALRDWVKNGEASRYVLSADDARERIAGPTQTDALAAANFRMGQYLRAQGHIESAARYFDEARRLCPERWHYFRQALDLEEKGKASGPEFRAALKALGERSFYAPINLEAKQ
jgi:hypothetical protein